ncbi:MAG: STAS domain-containing protein [Firmicutes bacterium]|nr:STAS domain-containing protein [Bacillota bacterium]
MLNISKEMENTRLTFSLEGKLDSVTSNDLESEIMNSLEGVEELVVDCEKLEYVSSAGLRVLLAALKLMNKQGTMKVTNVCDEIMSIFEMTGFSEILTIENNAKTQAKETKEEE